MNNERQSAMKGAKIFWVPIYGLLLFICFNYFVLFVLKFFYTLVEQMICTFVTILIAPYSLSLHLPIIAIYKDFTL